MYTEAFLSSTRAMTHGDLGTPPTHGAICPSLYIYIMPECAQFRGVSEGMYLFFRVQPYRLHMQDVINSTLKL